MSDESTQRLAYTTYSGAERRPAESEVPVEETFTLHINGRPIVQLMCTPVRLEELVLGFLFNEGLIEGGGDVEEVKVLDLPDGSRWLDAWLRHEIEPPRLRAITSGCSGGTTFGSVTGTRQRIASDVRITPQQITHLTRALARGSVLYRRSGGLHVAALADGERLICVAEDIGRHNALDKVAGLCLRQGQGQATQDHILLTSGRVSSEMVNKAARMSVPVVVSRSSPTSLSIHLARAWGITLIGYARQQSFRVYTGEERVVVPRLAGED